mmetsp:Transcript_31040/g.28233  ORF Transcript_31040/g.28233 Transcript_31040/m.28233 type:complete len:87 (+) Transcript_31040:744-1004(+)
MINKSTANQRAGRTGRTCPGICIRLYSKEEYDKLEPFEPSAINKINCYRIIMVLKLAGVKDIYGYDYLEKLSQKGIKELKDDIEFL